MEQDFEELYAEYYSDDREIMQSTRQAKLEPTTETIDYLSYVYEDIKRGSYLQHFEEYQEHFTLPLETWFNWFEEKSQHSVEILSVFAYLQEKKGITSPSESILTFELNIKNRKEYVIFVGRKAFETLMREYQSVGLIYPGDKLIYSVSGTNHLNGSMIENVLIEFAEMNFSERVTERFEHGHSGVRFTTIDSWNNFDKHDISDELIEGAHFIIWYQ